MNVDKFLFRLEQKQRIQNQKLMWELCHENFHLGGKTWAKVLRRYGIKKAEMYPTPAKSRDS